MWSCVVFYYDISFRNPLLTLSSNGSSSKRVHSWRRTLLFLNGSREGANTSSIFREGGIFRILCTWTCLGTNISSFLFRVYSSCLEGRPIVTVSLDCSRCYVKAIRRFDLRVAAVGYPKLGDSYCAAFIRFWDSRVSSLSYFQVERTLCLKVLYPCSFCFSSHERAYPAFPIPSTQYRLLILRKRAHALCNCQSFILFMGLHGDHRRGRTGAPF